MSKPDKVRRGGKPIASPDDTLEIARSLGRAGWPIFPVHLVPMTKKDGTPGTDKIPQVKWLTGATTDDEMIVRWFGGKFSGAWIGVHAERAGIVVADLDVAKGDRPDGAAELKRAGFTLPKTLRYRTRSGGRHLVYAAPEGVALTIAQDTPVKGVDIRAGHGLMVYYGPALDGAPSLAPAPDWLLVRKGVGKSSGEARAADGDVLEWIDRARHGKPSKAARKAAEAVTNDLDHNAMLEAVSDLIKLGTERGISTAYEHARETYIEGRPDRARDWDNAAAGSIGKHGLPPVTLELTKAERKAIAVRNSPAAIEEVKARKKAEFRAGKTLERAAEGAPVDVGRRDLTDASLAEELAEVLAPKWAHVGGVGLLRYSGIVWERVDEALLVETVRKRVRRIRADETAAAILRGDKKHEEEARSIESRNRIVAISRLASGIMLDRAPKLDADPDVLNTPTCVVDLRTGKTRDREPGDYFTKVTGAEYIPGATSADWTLALKALPKATRRWVQIRLGQAATGRISQDKSIPFFTGGGDNGKSVVIGGARNALGDYAVTVPERLLLGSDNDHPTDIMTLEGARLAVFEELPRGGRLNAQRIKLLAGTNKLSGRRMRQDFHEFTATHTLAGATNHLPMITDVDDAIWERMAPVPFPYKFVPPTDAEGNATPLKADNWRHGDPGLRDRLADEDAPADPAILAWLVEGAVESYKRTAPKPPAVLAALEEWRGDADPVLGFVRDHLVLDEGYAIVATELYAEFGRYLEGRSQPRWGDQLAATSFTGHSSLPGVTKRQVRFGPKLRISRPSTFMIKPPAPHPMAWVGVRFADDPNRVVSEAEADAVAFEDLKRRAGSK